MNTPLKAFISATVLATFGMAAQAATALQHNGATNPLAEGFSPLTYMVASTQGPLPNDLGRPAWSIQNSTTTSQFIYTSGSLSDAQKATVATSGFTLSFQARALQGSTPAVYTAANSRVLASAVVDTGLRRFDVGLALNANGDTVVVLPSSVALATDGVSSPGASYTLAGLGNGYHSYSLVLNGSTQLADLYVDGVSRLQNYAGHTSYVGDYGLMFAAANGGTGNFSTVQLSLVPEPATASLLLGGLLAMAWRSKRLLLAAA